MSQLSPPTESSTRLPAIAAAPPLAAVALVGDGGPLGLPRTYWLLWSGMLLNRLGGAVFCLLSVYLTRDRGLSAPLAGLVMALYAAGSTIAGPVGGMLADQVGRRATLLVGTGCSGLLMLALGFSGGVGTGAWMILTIAPLLGFFSDLCRPPLQAAVADVVAAEHRARAYALLYWAINLGFAGAAALGGALAEHNFKLLFVIDALTTFGYGAIVLLGVPETCPATSRASPRAGDRAALLQPFRDRRFMSFVAIQLLLLLAFVQVIVAMPLDMRNHGLPTSQIGWLLGLNGVIIVLAQPLALRFLRGFSQVHWLAAGAALTGVGLGAMALAGGAPVYAAASVLWTFGEIGFSTAAPTLVAELSPADRRGAYHGTYHLAWGVASMVAPLIGSLVLARLGGAALWLGCLAAGLAAGALHLIYTDRPLGMRRR
jgi:MFS family permease